MEMISNIFKKRIDGNIYPVTHVSMNDISIRVRDTNSVDDIIISTIETTTLNYIAYITPSLITASE